MSRQIIMYSSVSGNIYHTKTKDATESQYTQSESEAFVVEMVVANGYTDAVYTLVTAKEIIDPSKWKVNLDTGHLERVEQIVYE
jgi:hypothetical protein